jgi:tRNA G18 (ribose-2'-O)-methylase SpoU
MGSEGKGVSTDLMSICDFSVFIESGMRKTDYVFPNTMVDSLNVSVATALIVQRLREILGKVE